MEKKRSRKMMTIQHVLKSKSKCEAHPEMQMCMVNRLPSEILMEILSRLPTDSILQCRQVCRPWENLTRHPSFADMHLHQLSHLNGNSYPCLSSADIGAKVSFGLLFCLGFTRERGFQLYYGDYDDQPSGELRRVNQPFMNDHVFVGSCNGLICFSEMNFFDSVKFEPTYICNPITREYVKFPRLEVKGENKLDTLVCGFGYHHSIKKYKIVKIYYIQGQPLGRVQVYTLGSGSGWSDTGETNYSLRFSEDSWRVDSYIRSPIGTFANGAVHWLDKDQKIVSFDLASEKLYLLSSPPVVHAVNVLNLFQLQVLGGCLCFVHQKLDEFLDMWFLRKKGESNSSDLNEQDDDSLIWIKEFSMPIGGGAEPLTLTKSGGILLWYRSNLYCYDPKTADLEKISENGNGSGGAFDSSSVVPHMNTFVSLKALGERCRHRKRYDVNPSPKEFFITRKKKPNGETDA